MRTALLTVVLFLPLALRAQPREEPEVQAVQVRVDRVYYDVAGATAEQLGAALLANGPRSDGRAFFGLTRWEVAAQYRWVERATGCSIEAPVVQAEVEVVLPRWQAPPSAPAELRWVWERFVEALTEHEDGHRRLAEEAAAAVQQRLASLEVARCAEVDAVAQREVRQVLAEYERRNHAYDAETGHGRTQDAVWPPPAHSAVSASG